MNFKEFALSDREEERRKREEKAAAAGCTPFSVSVEDQSGVFGGTGGKYHTWLTECECMDFKRRELPCKHMYRLAHELGVYDLGEIERNPEAIREARRKVSPRERAKATESCIALIDGYPLDTQRAIQTVLYCQHVKRPCVFDGKSVLEKPLADGLLEIVDNPRTIIESNTQKRTVDGLLEKGFAFPPDLKKTKKARYEWCLENPLPACSLVYPCSAVIRTSGALDVARTKVYTYLNRKFEDGGEG